MPQKVVAHFIDHTIVKGTSIDVDPGKPRCHIQAPEQGSLEVDLAQLKALFFVKDLAGRPEHDEAKEPATGDTRLHGSHQVKLVFLDGEELFGLMNRYPPNRSYFFVLPVDSESNNIRILVNRDAVHTIEPLKEGGTRSAMSTHPPARPRRESGWVFDGKDIRPDGSGRRE
ncbi:MAG: hypothetical protein AMS20_07535 [Gemmatimonas sp. SG8_28]|jgi:hypothetical protein|nr:MAG: hypothetical protein AMS20_07535 [Gemmatimonas sp. SG8_28]